MCCEDTEPKSRRKPAGRVSSSRCRSAVWQANRETDLAQVEESLARVRAGEGTEEAYVVPRREDSAAKSGDTGQAGPAVARVLVAALRLLEDDASSCRGRWQPDDSAR